MLLTVRTLDGHALDVEVDAAGGIQVGKLPLAFLAGCISPTDVSWYNTRAC
jgi:hypothetical protein